MDKRSNIELYKGYVILQYAGEEGYRIDFGTMRSKRVDSIAEARELIDFYLSSPHE